MNEKMLYELLDNVWVKDVIVLGKVARVDIDGDWKHDHLRADYLMEQKGFTKVSESVIYSNGDDTYLSAHFYTC